jgi:hypothetical protein
MTWFLHRNGRSSERGRKTFTIASSLDSLAFSNTRLRAHERGLTIAGEQTRLVIVYIGDTHIGCPLRDRKPGARKSAGMRKRRTEGERNLSGNSGGSR